MQSGANPSSRDRGETAEPAAALGLAGESFDRDRSAPPGGSRPWSGWTVTALTAVGALLVGFLLTSGLSAGRDAAERQHERRAELVSLITTRQEHVEALQAQLDSVRTQVAEAEAEVAAGLPALSSDIAAAEAAAGLTGVRGPGLVVTLDDGPPDCSEFEENCRIHDTDLQLAVNELFAAGAEAVAVNDQRVVGTTAIRSAGRTIQVNYRPTAPPYVIEAVGDPAGMERALTASQWHAEFEYWEDVGLGYEVEAHDELDVPAYSGSVRMRTATTDGDIDVDSLDVDVDGVEIDVPLPLESGVR